MAYTPGLGRTPRIIGIRQLVAIAPAVVVVALGHWWPFDVLPGEGTVWAVLALGFVCLVVALAIPAILQRRPTRAVAGPEGLVIPVRRLTPTFGATAAMVIFTIGFVLAYAARLDGPRESSPVLWAVFAAITAYGTGYLLAQRPWLRRIELTLAALVLHTGEEICRIPWSDIAAVEQAPLLSNARSGMKVMREYNAAALTVQRHSDQQRPRPRRLEDHYPVGDLAAPFHGLLALLQQLAADPDARASLSDPAAFEQRLVRTPQR